MSALTMMQAIAAAELAIELPATVVSAEDLRDFKTVKAAYIHGPDKGGSLAALPCFINWYDAEPEQLRLGNFVEHHETVQVDFYAPDTDKGRLYAMAFYDATVAAFIAQQPSGQHFGGTVDLVNIRTEAPAIAPMEWNNLFYPGFRMYLDLQRFETVVPI